MTQWTDESILIRFRLSGRCVGHVLLINLEKVWLVVELKSWGPCFLGKAILSFKLYSFREMRIYYFSYVKFNVGCMHALGHLLSDLKTARPLGLLAVVKACHQCRVRP